MHICVCYGCYRYILIVQQVHAIISICVSTNKFRVPLMDTTTNNGH